MWIVAFLYGIGAGTALVLLLDKPRKRMRPHKQRLRIIPRDRLRVWNVAEDYREVR